MKISVVMGSPRKGDSFNICREIEEEIKHKNDDVQFDYIFLNQYDIKECRGCSLCFQKSEKCCPLKDDDLKDIKDKLLDSDGIIFASPVYAYAITSIMKKFIDRMSYLFHRQELIDIPSLIVVTTDGGGSSAVYKYLKMTLTGWGMDVLDNIQVISSMYIKDRRQKSAFSYNTKYHDKIHKKLSCACDKFYKSLNCKDKKTPTFYDIFMFNCLRSKTYTSEADRTYWSQKGWIDSEYFYNVQMNLIKRIFGMMMKNIINFIGRKYLNQSAQ